MDSISVSEQGGEVILVCLHLYSVCVCLEYIFRNISSSSLLVPTGQIQYSKYLGDAKTAFIQNL